MGGISQALAHSAEAAGATIRTGAPVRSIDVRDGRVTGVTLESSEELGAPIVASGAHPRTTVLDMTGAEHFPDEIVRDMRRYRSRGGSVKVNCVLSERPRYQHVPADDGERLLRTSFALCPSVDYLECAWHDAVRGVPAEGPYVEVEVPSAFGLADGSIFQGEQGLDQMAFMRPSPLMAQYATPVNGLYLCGAGTHPGGGVMAASGHDAAQRILRDRRSRRRRRRLVSRA
jgi:phytoene dehydrogenase-like protein